MHDPSNMGSVPSSLLPCAQMSVTLMVATLMQRLRFRPLPRPGAPAFPLQVAYDITMNFNPTGGLRMEVMPRERGAVGGAHAHVASDRAPVCSGS